MNRLRSRSTLAALLAMPAMLVLLAPAAGKGLAGAHVARDGARRAVAAYALTARVARATGEGAGGASCRARVVVDLGVLFHNGRGWSRGLDLVYQPPRGIRVLDPPPKAATAGLSHVKRRAHTSKSSRKVTRASHPDVASVIVLVPHPKHGRSTRTVTVEGVARLIRPRHGHGRLEARIGGLLELRRGRAILSRKTLNLVAIVACARSKGAPTAQLGAATPTPAPAQTGNNPGNNPATPAAATNTPAAGGTPSSYVPSATATTAAATTGSPTAQSTTAASTPTQTPAAGPSATPSGPGATATPSPTATMPPPTNTATATNTPTPTNTPQAGGPAVVTISNFAFAPQSITVPVGSFIMWVNKDNVDHTSTCTSACLFTWDTGHIAKNGGTAIVGPFTTAGTFQYICSIHQFMKGTVIVQ